MNDEENVERILAVQKHLLHRMNANYEKEVEYYINVLKAMKKSLNCSIDNSAVVSIVATCAIDAYDEIDKTSPINIIMASFMSGLCIGTAYARIQNEEIEARTKEEVKIP